MTKVTVDIPQSILDAKTKKELESLKRKVAHRDQKIQHLELRLQGQEEKIKRADKMIQAVADLAEEYAWAEIHRDCGHGY